MNTRLRTLACMGILAAISIILSITVRFPLFLDYLIYEPADVPILIAGFAFGPLAGIAVTLAVAVIMAAVTGLGGPFGALMHFIATGALVGTASLVYRSFHTRGGAALGLLLGTLAMTIIMPPANVFLTPIFYGIPRAAVLEVIWYIVAFNAVKAGINAVITFLLYKRISPILKGEWKGLRGQHGGLDQNSGKLSH